MLMFVLVLATLVAIYWFWIRPILKSRPAFRELYDKEESFFAALRAWCTQQNILLILDEVQSGLGRTGRWFAFEHENIRPDGLILGKALGGGLLPVSAFLADAAVMDVFTPGSHSSTAGFARRSSSKPKLYSRPRAGNVSS